MWSLLSTVKERCEMHPPRLCATSFTIFPAILLHLILYLLIIHSLLHSPTFCLHYTQWNLCPARWGITTHREIKKHTFRQHSHSRKQPMFIVQQMFAFQSSAFTNCIVVDKRPRYHWTARMMILVWRSVMMKVRAPQSPPYCPTLEMSSWITNRRSYI